jgi:hypothetical protein
MKVDAVAAQLADLKAQYEAAIKNGEDDAKLDERDERIVRTEREMTRGQIKLTQ